MGDKKILNVMLFTITLYSLSKVIKLHKILNHIDFQLILVEKIFMVSMTILSTSPSFWFFIH